MKGYQLKITLQNTSPPVWRRIWIPCDMTFNDLHEAIQTLFGWLNYHLYGFAIRSCNTVIICDESEKDIYTDETCVYMDTTLETYLKEGLKFLYTYDYGDNWVHQIVVEKECEERYPYIRLLKWKQDNLADDAGNVEGYKEVVAIAQDATHEDHQMMKEWLESQHIPFDEDMVVEELAYIGEMNPYPEMSVDVEAALEAAVSTFLAQLDEMDLPVMCLMQACEAESEKLMIIVCQETGYNIQMYDNEIDYVRGVENTPDIPGFNVYANGISIISNCDGFMPWDGWMSENESFIVKKMRSGYMPVDVDDETALTVIADIHLFTEILENELHKKLPDYADGRMIRSFRQPNGKLRISHPKIHLKSDDLEIHVEKEMNVAWKNTPVKVEEIRIDMITNSHEEEFDSIHMPIYLVMENDEYQLKIPLQGNIYKGYEALAHGVVATVCSFIKEHGRMRSIVVNNPNMAQILSGLCGDLNIPLCIEDFISEAQRKIIDDAPSAGVAMLQKLADMSEDEFYEFLDSLDEDQLEEISAMIEDNMDDYDLEIEDYIDSPRTKKHFDA